MTKSLTSLLLLRSHGITQRVLFRSTESAMARMPELQVISYHMIEFIKVDFPVAIHIKLRQECIDLFFRRTLTELRHGATQLLAIEIKILILVKIVEFSFQLLVKLSGVKMQQFLEIFRKRRSHTLTNPLSLLDGSLHLILDRRKSLKDCFLLGRKVPSGRTCPSHSTTRIRRHSSEGFSSRRVVVMNRFIILVDRGNDS
mmetsp:Transcript_29960/g.96052  ORF Transcript_29960/g.96052 Transcript_29960/m.96052 type:complete len:200 (+) Transcript_29960:1751-2350(+)